MKGRINNFRRSVKRTYSNQMIVIVEGINSKEKAKELIGKKVKYFTGKKEIIGVVKATHGNKGAVRVVFEKGMPGQSIGKEVEIL